MSEESEPFQESRYLSYRERIQEPAKNKANDFYFYLSWLFLLAIVSVAAVITTYLVIGTPSSAQTVSSETTTCSVDTSQLPDVETNRERFRECEDYDGLENAGMYFDTLTSMTISTIDGSVAPSGIQVCLPLCDTIELPTTCLSENTEYLDCLFSFQIDGCANKSFPLARRDTEHLYPIAYGRFGCFE